MSIFQFRITAFHVKDIQYKSTSIFKWGNRFTANQWNVPVTNVTSVPWDKGTSVVFMGKTPVLLCTEAWYVHVYVAAETNGALVRQKGRSQHVYKSAHSAISSDHSTEATVIDS